MTETTFEQMDALKQSEGAAAAIERLIDTLRARKEFHRLFDALLLRKKFEMGLPLVQPTSFDDVPADRQEEFEESYIAAAREVGELLLADNDIPRAWVYLRTIREPRKVREAIEALDFSDQSDEQTEQILHVALHEGAHPTKGLELLLRTHGTCNTITAMDQMAHQLTPEDRQQSAALLVRELYDELSRTVRYEIEKKSDPPPPGASLRELMAGRDWLFEGGNYHIDVSHLNAVVRFARFLDPCSPELLQAIELAEYGARLAPQLQYPGDPPFDDFYPAHIRYLQVLANENRDEALDYFREVLEAEPDEEDKPILAFVLVDLLARVDRLDDALDVAEQHLKNVDPSSGFSFAQLCQEAGRLDTLRKVARERGDLVSYTAALVQDGEVVSR